MKIEEINFEDIEMIVVDCVTVTNQEWKDSKEDVKYW